MAHLSSRRFGLGALLICLTALLQGGASPPSSAGQGVSEPAARDQSAGPAQRLSSGQADNATEHSPLDASGLRPGADDLPLQHGIALIRAREGDLEGATAALERLRARCRDDVLSERMARDIERIRCFGELRAKFLAELAATGGRLRIDRDGRELQFNVERVEAGRVVFQNSRAGISALPLSELDSYRIAPQISRTLADVSQRWVRIYPYVLAGNERWSGLLRRDAKGSEEADRLRADASTWYPEVLRLGEAGLQLEALALRGEPQDTAAAEGSLELVRRLLGEHGDLELVKERREILRSLSISCFEKLFETEDFLGQLAGRVDRRKDGPLLLTYEFERPEELEDFRAAPGYPPDRLAVLSKLSTPLDQGRFGIRDGKLVVAGSKSWRCTLPFEGPITVRCQLTVEVAPKGGNPACFWMLGACDDGQESFVALQELGTAMAIDKASAFVSYSAVPSGTGLTPGKTYELELFCDERNVLTKVDGQLVKSIDSGGRDCGGVFFVVHSDAPVLLDRIQIEGTPATMARCQIWIEEQLAGLGFGLDGVQ